jgi:galactose-1-phosphate uridylyltransferase
MTAEGGLATVVAYWYEGRTRTGRTFQIDFSNARIAEVAELIRGLHSTYEGTTDDASDYRLCVSTGTERLETHVYETTEWDEDVKSDMLRFRQAWEPIAVEIENLLSLSHRN